MARAMFEYTKEVLQKVSFDVSLFIKEVQKAIKVLLPHEIIELKEYVKFLSQNNPELRESLVYIDS